jgi:hypothetical protein
MKKSLAMISQSMEGLPKSKIEETEKNAVEYLENLGYEVAKTYFKDFDISRVKNAPLYYLAKSLEVLSNCDILYLCKGWDTAKRCRIEYQCALNYNIEIIKEEG